MYPQHRLSIVPCAPRTRLGDFMATQPKLQLDVVMDDRYVHLLENNIYVWDATPPPSFQPAPAASRHVIYPHSSSRPTFELFDDHLIHAMGTGGKGPL